MRHSSVFSNRGAALGTIELFEVFLALLLFGHWRCAVNPLDQHYIIGILRINSFAEFFILNCEKLDIVRRLLLCNLREVPTLKQLLLS